VPSGFLSAEQVAAYGRYAAEEPSRAVLELSAATGVAEMHGGILARYQELGRTGVGTRAADGERARCPGWPRERL